MNSEGIEFLFVEESFVLRTSLYNAELRKSNPQKPDFTFEDNKRWIPALFKRELYYGTDQYFVSLEVVDVRTIGFFLFAIGSTIYYVLFTVWGLIQLYHANRLKLIWVLGLVVLNVVGYVLFLLKSKRDISKIPR
ncbi:hypothetical protein [Parageobacillus thermoglucosidasius]|uniref:Uncharacterized protein n=1 Tax=Parageobacillus thermoglucosidasius TaxID=1426 RepID=A0AAN0YQ19_PARTM|nr:hypothetical protein [Parageobacillus thermoglucosidasius]ALF10890.1 hypothetical protein AOT13_13175 [Parageobacillus thermoglucosidasius]ANZ30966.1 hypothetical protein BCV53_13185 [Parageobacillus thermoglucosidasius]APM81703.1 hypothetical protein BCV54_13195 [Parageobacillus thermoglucosidasius]KJX69158.1 hypothetical protein WH82_08125 [Parageobacillus thermoglucosidasius]RDE25436.1 hypothetical protein DV712_00350 [Parageobacillus thermoglucosidasius]